MARKRKHAGLNPSEQVPVKRDSDNAGPSAPLEKIKTGSAVSRILFVAGIFIFSLSLRITYQNHTTVDQPVRADARDYFAYAQNLVRHGIYSHQLTKDTLPIPDAKRPPGYGLYLSAFYRLSDSFQTFYRSALLGQAVIDSLTVLATFLLASLFLPLWAAIGSSFLVAINPHMIVMTGYLLSETLFTFFLAFAVLTLCFAMKRGRTSFLVLAGALFGAATLTRSVLALFPPLAGLYYWYHFRRENSRRGALAALVLLASFFITLSPWFIRNTALGDSSTSQPSIARYSFVHGSYPGFIFRSTESYGYPYREDPKAEYMYSSWSNTIEILSERVKADPLKYAIWYGGGKVLALWGWDLRPGGLGDIYSYPFVRTGFIEVGVLRKVRSVSKAIHWPTVAMGYLVLVLYLTGRHWKKEDTPSLTLCILLIVYFSVIHTALAPFPRYSIPLRPYLYTMAIALWTPRFIMGRGRNREKKTLQDT